MYVTIDCCHTVLFCDVDDQSIGHKLHSPGNEEVKVFVARETGQGIGQAIVTNGDGKPEIYKQGLITLLIILLQLIINTVIIVIHKCQCWETIQVKFQPNQNDSFLFYILHQSMPCLAYRNSVYT